MKGPRFDSGRRLYQLIPTAWPALCLGQRAEATAGLADRHIRGFAPELTLEKAVYRAVGAEKP
jgi:hypothetical protein